jgi:hypothetical protein
MLLRGSLHLGKILGYSFSPIKFHLSRRVGREDIRRRQWELLENRVYNKPNGCSATGALALGPDYQQQHHVARELRVVWTWPTEWSYALEIDAAGFPKH